MPRAPHSTPVRFPDSARSRNGLGVIGFSLLLLFVLSQPLRAHEIKVGDIEIVHPRSRATHAGAKIAGGYLEIKNAGSQLGRLVSATVDLAGRRENLTGA